MTDMVTRVAQRMYKAARAEVTDRAIHIEEDVDPSSVLVNGYINFEYLARAAIAEMRENTPAMSEAMGRANMNAIGGYEGPSGWEAAIDAALKENEEKAS